MQYPKPYDSPASYVTGKQFGQGIQVNIMILQRHSAGYIKHTNQHYKNLKKQENGINLFRKLAGLS